MPQKSFIPGFWYFVFCKRKGLIFTSPSWGHPKKSGSFNMALAIPHLHPSYWYSVRQARFADGNNTARLCPGTRSHPFVHPFPAEITVHAMVLVFPVFDAVYFWCSHRNILFVFADGKYQQVCGRYAEIGNAVQQVKAYHYSAGIRLNTGYINTAVRACFIRLDIFCGTWR